MASSGKTKEYVRRIMIARMRLLCDNGFFGLLLMHTKMGLSEKYPTCYNNGSCIFFNPDFLDRINDDELKYVLMHEVMHIVLHHLERGRELIEDEKYNKASDIVVNSAILEANRGDEKSITLREFGVGEHITPKGDEGYLYSVEEIFKMLMAVRAKGKKDGSGGKASPTESCPENGEGNEGSPNGGGKGGKAGKSKAGEGGSMQGDGDSSERNGQNPGGFDWHLPPKNSGQSSDEEEFEHQMWMSHIKAAKEAMEQRFGSETRGLVPACVERKFDELEKPITDWRTVLNEFIQEEINDYSFTPPDRRFDDSPFFLPDYNEKDDSVRDILFFIDTSGSMSDGMITQAYSEIKGAIDQFNGKLTGWLGFFDAVIVPPVRFEDEGEFRIIRPKGGGGTDFDIIFRYVQEEMEEPPISIIILTDGYAPYPDEKEAMGIPVLWMINNEKSNPPWGRVVRFIKEDEGEYSRN